MTATKNAGMPTVVVLAMRRAEEQRRQFDPEPPHPSTEADCLELCAGLDHSDTDNGKRLKIHFGTDLLVIGQEKAKQPLYAVWTGTHWDVANGGPKALAIAQKLGERIGEETRYLKPTVDEQRAIDAGADAKGKPEDRRDIHERKLVESAERATIAHGKRIKRRMDHAVSSKNIARMNAALACLAPHVMKMADDFNADRMMFATRNATLKFSRQMMGGRNPKFLDRQQTPDTPETIEVCTGSDLEIVVGHRRKDLITHVVPVDYDPLATCPRWIAFLDKMQPEAAVRRLIQVSSGLALVGLTVQKLFFHYGDGANGKSVYMETLCRLLGEVAVTLPSSSLIGENGSSGSASPDLARLYGRRLLRVKELPEGEDLREALVKELTGGEKVTARDLFSGYLDFEALFVAMMSGNGYPRITGTDNGIWRRIAVVHWPVKIPEHEQREFSDMLSYFEPEYPGILNWLIEGVHIFLREGVFIPEAVRAATQDYRDEMDRTAAFVARCVVRDEAADPLQARDLYAAYSAFTIDEGGKPINVTAFGRAMSKKFRKDTSGRFVVYRGIRLRDVPDIHAREHPPSGRFRDDEPFPEDYS